MSLEELKKFSDAFEEDIYDAISMETCVNKRLTIGAPGKEAMEKVIAIEEEYLTKDWEIPGWGDDASDEEDDWDDEDEASDDENE